MAFGTFDIFHEGHEHYLKEAKKLGESLLVVIALDRTVKQIKGEYPVNSEQQRAETVKKSGLADKVILGYHGDKHKVIKKYKPSVIALGYDQFTFTQRLKKTLIDLNLDTTIIRIEPFHPHIYKSSLIKKRLQSQTENNKSAAIEEKLTAVTTTM